MNFEWKCAHVKREHISCLCMQLPSNSSEPNIFCATDRKSHTPKKIWKNKIKKQNNLVPGGAYEPSKWYGLLRTVNISLSSLLILFLVFNYFFSYFVKKSTIWLTQLYFQLTNSIYIYISNSSQSIHFM